jgi:hypothetical protein
MPGITNELYNFSVRSPDGSIWPHKDVEHNDRWNWKEARRWLTDHLVSQKQKWTFSDALIHTGSNYLMRGELESSGELATCHVTDGINSAARGLTTSKGMANREYRIRIFDVTPVLNVSARQFTST